MKLFSYFQFRRTIEKDFHWMPKRNLLDRIYMLNKTANLRKIATEIYTIMRSNSKGYCIKMTKTFYGSGNEANGPILSSSLLLKIGFMICCA